MEPGDKDDIRKILNQAIPETEDLADQTGEYVTNTRWRFGLGLIISALFLMIVSVKFPGDHDWILVGLSLLMLFIGAWYVDSTRKQRLQGKDSSKKPPLHIIKK